MATQALKPYKFKGKGVTALLGNEPDTSIRTKVIPLAHIKLPAQQPRRYFDPQTLQELMASIRVHGILTPLLVRPISYDNYELVAGERRFRAAQELALAEVPVSVRDLSDTQAAEVALLENLQREDLNPVEETEGILELLERKLGKGRADIITLLNRAAHPKRASVQNVLHSPEWKAVEAVFASVGRFTPNSFRASRLPLLKLPAEILAALREGRIEYTKAQAIARVKDQQEREQLLEEAIAQQLSLKQIKQRIKSQKKTTQHPSKRDNPLQRRWRSVQAKLRQEKIWEQPEIVEALTPILNELEEAVMKLVSSSLKEKS